MMFSKQATTKLKLTKGLTKTLPPPPPELPKVPIPKSVLSKGK